MLEISQGKAEDRGGMGDWESNTVLGLKRI